MAVDSIARALALSGGSVTRTSQLINDSGFIGEKESKAINGRIDKNSKTIRVLTEALAGKEIIEEEVIFDESDPAEIVDIPENSYPYAGISAIGGRSLPMLQYVKNGSIKTDKDWYVKGTNTSLDIDTESQLLTLSMGQGVSGNKRIYQTLAAKIPANNVVLISFDFWSDGNSCSMRFGQNDSSTIASSSNSVFISGDEIASYQYGTHIGKAFKRDIDCQVLTIGTQSTTPTEIEWKINNIQVYDLTEAFGITDVSEVTDEIIEQVHTFYGGNVFPETLGYFNVLCNRVTSYGANGDVIGTLNIPQEVLALDGYGQAEFPASSAIDSNMCNYIEFTDTGCNYVQNGKIIDGVFNYFEEPIITDISDYLNDNMIKVEEGGFLEFDNTLTDTDYVYIGCPYKLGFLIKVSPK